MKHLIFLSLFSILMTACSGQKSTVSSNFKIFSASALMKSIPAGSDIIVYGNSSEGKSFSRNISTDSHTIELPKGTWNIYAVIWHPNSDGTGEKFKGKTECGVKENLILSDKLDKADVDIDVSNAFCNNPAFTQVFSTSSDGSILFPQLVPFHCFNGVDGLDYSRAKESCYTGSMRGPATAFKIKYFNLTNFDSLNQRQDLVIQSKCYEIGGEYDLKIPINFPVGSLVIEYFFTPFEANPCSSSDGVQEINFNLNESGRGSAYFNNREKNKLGVFTQARSDLLYNPRNFTVSDATRNRVSLSWLSAGGRASRYKIVKSTSKTSPTDCTSITAISLSGSTNFFRAEGLTPDINYYFRICSVDDAGNMSSGVELQKRTHPRVSISSITKSDESDTYLEKDEILTLEVTTTDSVTFDSTSRIKLNLKNTYVYADYNSSSSGTVHSFVYTADYGDYHPRGNNIIIGEIQGTARDREGNLMNEVIPASHKSISGMAIETCPSSQSIHVPRNLNFGDYNFCVMKYEAQEELDETTREPTGHVISEVSSPPWVSVSASEAQAACEATDYIGDDLSLISNNEWMTIARSIEANSTDNRFEQGGTNYFYRGHTDNAWIDALDNNQVDTVIIEGADPTGGEDGYIFTNNSTTSSRDQRRTLYLSNGEVIWDFSGNAAEWVDSDIINCSKGDFSRANCESLGPISSAQYLGKIINEYTEETHTDMARGGDFDDAGAGDAGIYAMLYSDGSASTDIGFRCVLRPDSER